MMSGHTQTLADGSILTHTEAPYELSHTAWHGTTAVLVHAGHMVRLTFTRRTPDRVGAAAGAAGAVLALWEVPLIVLCGVAHLAATRELPSADHLLCYDLAVSTLTVRTIPGASLTTRLVRTLVDDTLGAHADSVSVPDMSWDAARALVAYGRRAWSLRGESAWHWGTRPLSRDPPHAFPHTTLAMLMSAVLDTPQRHALPVPVHPVAQRMTLGIDWLLLAAGPAPIPRSIIPDGIGTPVNEARLHHSPNPALPIGTARTLEELAAGLLAVRDRPRPRYIGRALDVSIPADLLAHLSGWGIVAVRVVPAAEGLWIATLDARGQRLASLWWHAHAASGARYPLRVPHMCWAVLHPVCAALWYDLCADAIVVPPAPLPVATSKPHSSTLRRSTSPRHVVLPPIRTTAVAWADATDRHILQRSCAVGHGYRRLPTGWETRADHRDWQRRRIHASERAERYGYPAPPPGFTFVKPFIRGLSNETAADIETNPKLTVRSRGLFTLLVGLQPGAPAAVVETAGDSPPVTQSRQDAVH